MKKAIKPKETQYAGYKFASRLEARWAVFFDHHSLITDWRYEPRKFQHPETGWFYTPDFYIAIGNFRYLLEVKPEWPKRDYLADLKTFLDVLPLPLLIGFGDFYKDNTPSILTLKQGRTLKKSAKPLNRWELLAADPEALNTAKGVRFDLPFQRPPHRKGSFVSPEHMLNHWKETNT